VIFRETDFTEDHKGQKDKSFEQELTEASAAFLVLVLDLACTDWLMLAVLIGFLGSRALGRTTFEDEDGDENEDEKS
jgi:hypothetical protein